MKRLFLFAALAFHGATALAADAGAPPPPPPPEKVAVMPFVGDAPKSEIDDARTATMGAVISRGEPLATPSELVTAETAAAGAPNDTKAQYEAAGRASSSQWVVVGHVKPHPASIPGYHLEIEACQVSSGRVESLARDIDPTKANAQIAEMLALLLRPEGIGNSPIPWENDVLQPPPPPPPKPPPPKPPPPPPKPPPPKPAEPEPDRGYGIHAPFALGIGLGVDGAFAHPPIPAQVTEPSTFAFEGTITGEWAPLSAERYPKLLRGVALRADLGGNLYGPAAVLLDGGVRWAIPIVPKLRIFVGPEVTIGGFFVTTGDQESRFLLRTDAFAAMGFGEHFQLELAFDVQTALGGTGTIVTGGTMLRGLVRF